MAKPGTSPQTIARISADVEAFADVDISVATGPVVQDLLRRVAALRSWISGTESLLVTRAEVLATPPPAPRRPSRPTADNPDAPTLEPDSPMANPPADATGEPAGPSAQDILTRQAKASNAQARRLRRRAELLQQLTAFHQALLANLITPEHVDAIVDLLRNSCGTEHADFIALAHTTQLHEIAAEQTVDTFKQTIKQLLHTLRKETPDQALARQIAQTFLNMWTNRDGMLVVNGEFDPEAGNYLRAFLDDAASSLFTAHANKQLHIPDNVANKAGWLRAQALLQHLTGTSSGSAAPSGDAASKPSAHGADSPALRPPAPATTLVLYADLLKLTDRLWESTGEACGHFADGTPVGARTIRRLACDAGVMPLILDGNGQPLDAGLHVRTANRSQRRALQKMYPTCMFCDTPFNWCQIHHFWHWVDNGPTDLWNMGPVCSHHHHQIHDHQHTIRQNADGTLTLRAPDGSALATTQVTHPRPPADVNITTTSYSSATQADPESRGSRRGKSSKLEPDASTTPPVRPETVPWIHDPENQQHTQQPTRAPDPALF